MRIRIEGNSLPGRNCAAEGHFPGYHNIHVGIRRRNAKGHPVWPESRACREMVRRVVMTASSLATARRAPAHNVFS